MRTLRRRRVIVPAAVAFVVVAVVSGAAWYLLSEERRMGSAVERVLAGRTGLPIKIQRASWDGRRLLLRDVRLAPGPELALDIRVSELEIDSGIMVLVSPAGRPVNVVARSVSITLPESSASEASGVEPLRSLLLGFLGWPGELKLRVEGGELHTSRGMLTFDLTGQKQGPGLTLALTVAPRGEHEPLRLNVRGAAALGQALDLAVDVAGSLRIVGVLWPAVTPPASPVAGRVQLQLLAGGVASSFGRLTFGTNGTRQTAIDFASRYDTTSGDVNVSRYALSWGEDVRVTGTARLTSVASDRRRVTATVEGDAAGSKVSVTGGYELRSGAFEADVTVDLVDTARARRLGLDVPLELAARNVHARVAGRADAETAKARVDATAAHLTTGLRKNFTVAASLAATVTVVRGPDGFRLRSMEGGKLGLSRDGKPLLTATVASPANAPWPIAIDARFDDLGQAAPLLPLPAVLAGSAHVRGSLTSAQPATFRGTLQARLPRARLQIGGAIELSEIRFDAPVTVGIPGDPPPGSVGAARVVAYGLAFENLAGRARLADDRALLSELTYTQYGGKGTGWVDATRRAGSPPFRGRFEAEGVDLARFVKESGATVARITGIVRYVATAQYLRDHGLVADAHIESTSGGEVSIDAIEALLSSASVQEESTGILKRTLENLRVFEYESLEGNLRYRGSAGYIDLSLRGKKRFGIFPAPVEALNFRNVPLPLLVRTLTKGSTP
jgi:hypothetical protein